MSSSWIPLLMILLTVDRTTSALLKNVRYKSDPKSEPRFSMYVVTTAVGHPDRQFGDNMGYWGLRPHNASVEDMAKNELYETRVKIAMRTWVPRTRRSEVTFLGGISQQDAAPMLVEMGEAAQRVHFVGTPCDAQDKVSQENGHSFGVCCKTMTALDMSLKQQPPVEWVVRVVDDTYVFEDHLAELLQRYDHRKEEDVMLGSSSVQRWFLENNTTKDIIHLSGGAGMVLSRPLVQKFVSHKEEFLSMCTADDVDMSRFAQEKFGVSVEGSSAFSQMPRFENVKGLDPVTRRPSDCSKHPYPPTDVFAQAGGGKPWTWFEIGPFAAQPFTKLALVHSDPVRAWPAFAELSDMSRASGSCDQELFSYLDNPGGVALAQQHFFGLSELSICLRDKRSWLSRLASAFGAKNEACDSDSVWKTKAFQEFSSAAAA